MFNHENWHNTGYGLQTTIGGYYGSCPSCGYCQHCGRGGQYWQRPGVWWGNTGQTSDNVNWFSGQHQTNYCSVQG